MFNFKNPASSRSRWAKRGAQVSAVIAAVGLLAGCSQGTSSDSSSSNSSAASSVRTLQDIKDSGELRIGLEGTYKPYSYHDDNGTLTGIEVEIATLIAGDLGVKPVFVETKWDSLIAGLDINRYDLVLNDISPTDERKEKYDFSIPYITTVGKVAVKSDSSIQTLADMSGKNSAQTPTSNWGQAIQEQGANIVPVDGFASAIELVRQGRADATANSLVTLNTYLEDNPDSEIRLLDEDLPVKTEEVALINKGNDTVTQAVNDSLQKHMDNGDLKAIYEKYVGVDLTPAQS